MNDDIHIHYHGSRDQTGDESRSTHRSNPNHQNHKHRNKNRPKPDQEPEEGDDLFEDEETDDDRPQPSGKSSSKPSQQPSKKDNKGQPPPKNQNNGKIMKKGWDFTWLIILVVGILITISGYHYVFGGSDFDHSKAPDWLQRFIGPGRHGDLERSEERFSFNTPSPGYGVPPQPYGPPQPGYGYPPEPRGGPRWGGEEPPPPQDRGEPELPPTGDRVAGEGAHGRDMCRILYPGGKRGPVRPCDELRRQHPDWEVRDRR